jgi:hypothetical protein
MSDRDDDDLLTGTVPAPDAEPTAAERAHARSFADLVDKSLTGKPMPPAMSADDRALLEVATVIRAGTGNAELSAEKRHSIVEDALHQAIGGKGATKTGSVTPIAKARQRRVAPWVIAGASALVAAAAILLFWLRTPERAPAPETAQQVPVQWKSRPADALIGPIARERVGDAATRIDTIFADRLDGFRERSFATASAARGRKP